MNLSVTNLSLFETDKYERQMFAEAVTSHLLEGIADPLKVHLQVKCMEDIIKKITSTAVYKDLVVSEAMRYGKSFEHHNAKFEVKETGVKYEFDNCGDPVLNQLLDHLSDIEWKIKERQKFLKGIPSAGEKILVGDELVTIYPPTKISTTSVSVTLK